ncbi:hypothetical protein DVH05_022360 [Phytophthora capsici]|nr:hypothetical protein DVH05_022360 [Phytophthora capsici]
MEEIGPSPGLLALPAFLQAAAIEETSLYDGSAAPDTGLGLLADVAIQPMRSPAPLSPIDLFLLNASPLQLDDSVPSGVLMGVTMDFLYEGLDAGNAGPLPDLSDVA